jgi:leucyl-tRNA synthetase
MPGWAGSSWYWMRYMDAHNDGEFASKKTLKYWESVDLYIGGSEHATGHLLYSRFWNKFLKDKGFAPTEEPFKKLINQGMILGVSYFSDIIYGINKNDISDRRAFMASYNTVNNYDKYFSFEGIEFEIESKEKGLNRIEFGHKYVDSRNRITESSYWSILRGELSYGTEPINNLMNNIIWESDLTDEGEKYIYCTSEIEKMSKSKYNVVLPDNICNEYGADTLRLYEMFLGPLEQAKPWNTAGISGVFGFLKKLWRLYFDDNGLIVTNDEPTKDNLKSLHKTIKKVAEDIEGFSFNTSVSQFMICVNEFSAQNCHSRAILEPLSILISPYAPHIAEELWSQLGNSGSISTVDFPILDEKHLVESSKEYPVSFNGKMRFTIELSLDLTVPEIQEIIMKDERTLKQLDGKMPNKVIIVPGKIINLVG